MHAAFPVALTGCALQEGTGVPPARKATVPTGTVAPVAVTVTAAVAGVGTPYTAELASSTAVDVPFPLTFTYHGAEVDAAVRVPAAGE